MSALNVELNDPKESTQWIVINIWKSMNHMFVRRGMKNGEYTSIWVLRLCNNELINNNNMRRTKRMKRNRIGLFCYCLHGKYVEWEWIFAAFSSILKGFGFPYHIFSIVSSASKSWRSRHGSIHRWYFYWIGIYIEAAPRVFYKVHTTYSTTILLCV